MSNCKCSWVNRPENYISHVAIKFGDKIISGPMPLRHHHLIHIANQCGLSNPTEQGFLLNKEFINRQDAAEYAIKINQIDKLIAPPNLYSEDLW